MSRHSSLQAAIAMIAVLCVSACATTAESAGSPAAAENGTHAQTNQEYVQRVERIAMQRGIVVKWVNPPLKRKPRAD